MNHTALKEEIESRWQGQVRCSFDASNATSEVTCARPALVGVCRRIIEEWGFSFAGLIVEEAAAEWQLRYAFYGEADAGCLLVLVSAPIGEMVFPSVVEWIHAADWHEREAEDLFGVRFEGHPHLGDFVLHNDAWQESVEPMRRGFDAEAALRNRLPDADWRPRRIVHEPGAFIMPIGPKFGGVTESVHFLLETVGEDVIRSSTRLFYKWRAVEKLAEGKTVDEVLLLAERFAATTAFAHGLAFSLAVESIGGIEVPARGRTLRVFLAELERLRQHAGAIEGICESTALVVATSQAGILEEELLRVTGELTGHRYLFGLLAPGGLLRDMSTEACRRALSRSQDIVKRMNELERRLSISSSFLDRIEEVGFVSAATAKAYSLVGPIARASGLSRDLRRARPYSGYDRFNFDIPTEQEGDGYARLRLLFAEARQSVRIMEQAVAELKEGDVCRPVPFRPGAALGSVEAPRGATFHWVRLDAGGRISRYRVITPSFTNWHSFNLAAEKFAFQDFPIILSTFDLSVAENDR
jgi:Ni,Fe-hydrogenase III large subunit/Ni,Fe-hydrogenase III component G